MPIPVDLDAVQPTLHRLVSWLNEHDFRTTDSGDGVTNVEAGMECALDFAHVFIEAGEAPRLVPEADRLKALLEVEGITLDDQEGPYIEASYRPTDKVPIVALYGLTDADLPEGFGEC